MTPTHGDNILPSDSKHRESIVRAPHKTINSRHVLDIKELAASATQETRGTPSKPQKQPGKRPTEQSPNRPTNQSTGETKWMAKLCVEPPGDAGTCCLGWWVPCLLAGRNDWKMDRWSKGLPVESDHSAEARGWNMWCFFHLLARLVCIERVLIIIDRIRVRKVYDIEGNAGLDCVTGWFCSPCALMQHSREIRARAGDSSLVTNKKDYPPQQVRSTTKVTHQQPTRPQPMRYVSPRVYTDSNSEHVVPPRAALQNKKNLPGSQGSNASQVAARPDKSRGKQQNNDDHEMDDLAPREPHASQVAARLNKFEKKQQKRINHSKNGLACDQSKTSLGHSAPSRKAKEGPAARQIHRTETDVGTSSEESATLVSTKKVGEHNLDECDVIHLKQVQELSYVHDFSDCPVDKSVLEHFEKQENRSRQHRAVSCVVQGSTKDHDDDEDTDIGQHRLASCPIPSTGLNYKTATSSHHVPENARIDGDSLRIEDQPSTDHILRDCVVYATKKREGRATGSNGLELNYSSGPQKAGGTSSSSKSDHGGTTKNKRQNEARHNKGKDPETGSSHSHTENRNKTSTDASHRPREHSAQHALSKVLESGSARKENSLAASERGGSVRGLSEKPQS